MAALAGAKTAALENTKTAAQTAAQTGTKAATHLDAKRARNTGTMCAADVHTVVYVDGVFDLFHYGHVAFLKRARAVGGPGARLLVGVMTDDDARWKRQPVMAHAERLAVVRHCTEVGAVVEHPPLVISSEFLDAYGIDLVVHGDDSKQEDFFRAPIERGIMRYVPYEEGISTSAIIARVQARDEQGQPHGARAT